MVMGRNIIFSFCIIYALCLAPLYCLGSERPVVKTTLGKVKGVHKKSYNNRVFSAFEGIPYAKPPVGGLRFKRPKPVEPWEGIWEATTPHECLQAPYPSFVVLGEEDCLYINVYVPREIPNKNEKLDVIVNIHGGAFMVGNGHSHSKPKFLMDRDVILVTFNYRLGILGFLSTEDDVVPGNNGLKDQNLALRWVQKNIASFGGNPDSVTISGLSAGGASVHFHYFSPLSKGIFHRGIAQSGVSLNSWTLQEGALEKAKKLATSLGCDQTEIKDFINCLRQRPAKAIVGKTAIFYNYLLFPVTPFAPVIEKPCKKAFLSEHPYQMLKAGNINDVPLITSITTEEGIYPTVFLEDHLKEIDENWSKLAVTILNFNKTVSDSEKTAVAEKVRKFYFGDKPISKSNTQTLIKLFTERFFATDAELTARLHYKHAKSPVYFYVLGYRGERSLEEIFSGKKSNHGVSHGDDLLYLFDIFDSTKLTDKDEQMKEIFLDMFTTFAKTSKPKVPGVKEWTPVSDKFTYLNIKAPKQVKLEETEEFSHRKFWKSLPIKENGNLFVVKDEL